MIKVRSEIRIYEYNDKEYNGPDIISTLSHWNRNELVTLEIPDDQNETFRITVSASDLMNAIKNARNTGRF